MNTGVRVFQATGAMLPSPDKPDNNSLSINNFNNEVCSMWEKYERVIVLPRVNENAP